MKREKSLESAGKRVLTMLRVAKAAAKEDKGEEEEDAFEIGDRVRLAGGAELAELNGRVGVVVESRGKGRFIVDPERRLELVVPDLTGFKLKPYVSVTTPKERFPLARDMVQFG